MTLYEYLHTTTDWETTVWDKDYDVEVYFYKGDDEDSWSKSMNELSKLLTITEFNSGGIIVNLSEIIKQKIPQLKKAKLFIRCNIDAIMDDMDNILAGNVSEEWLTEFVRVLSE